MIMELNNRKKYLVRKFYDEYLDLNRSMEDERLTVESIRNGVEFRGANLWILVFATFIASLGLNVNSTAVVIGAMLISPLMGPIMGVGLAAGINDFDLMKRSMKNYFITTAFSVTTATTYFAFTPLDEVQSELLARTSPSIYDVFIALVGGLAGIVAVATKEKGNVIPGVAIATALMPPLCTAGFGLATGNLLYFLGAFYLYFINSVFISLATFLGVRFMKFKHKEFVDKNRERLVRKYIVTITLVTMCPAIYLTYGIVKETFYHSAVDDYITEELQFPNSQILSREISYPRREIKVVMVGGEISESQIAAAERKLEKYNLGGTRLVVIQGMNSGEVDISNIRSMVMEDFYKKSEQRLAADQHEIDSLKARLMHYTRSEQADVRLAGEMKALFGEAIRSVALSRSVRLELDSLREDTLTFAILQCAKEPSAAEKKRMTDWLRTRTDAKKLELIITE